MRWFVAVEVPTAAIRALAPASSSAPSHLTIRFLGEVDPAHRDGVRVALSEAAIASSPFSFELRGVGAFPDLRRPRVVWIGVGRGAEGFRALAGATDAALERQGIPRDRRPFAPHVTLFRVRGRADVDRAQALHRDLAESSFGEGTAVEMALYDSRLTTAGAVHTREATFPLRGPPAAPDRKAPAAPPSFNRGSTPRPERHG